MVDFLIELAAEIVGDVAEEKLSRQASFRKLSPLTRFFLGLGAAAVIGLLCYVLVTFLLR